MKSFIVYTLLFAITLQTVGCMSFYPVEKSESISDYLKTENRLDIRLNNGDKFIISSKDCRFIDKPGDYIFGVGTKINKITQAGEPFRGEIKKYLIDSIKNITNNSKKYVSYQMKDSQEIIFEEPNIWNVSIEKAPDFLVITSDSIIYNKDIKWMRVEKLNPEKTLAGLLVGGAFVTFFVLMLTSNLSIGGIGNFKL